MYKPIYNPDGSVKNVNELKDEITARIPGTNIDKPLYLRDKINWLKVYDVSKRKGFCADKINVHKFSEEKLGKDICIPILNIYDSADDIDFSKLPDKFVLKCNHGYNMNVICKSNSDLNHDLIKNKLSKWKSTDFGLSTLQLHYSHIDRKIFAEKYMCDSKQSGSLIDYKFWCFNGVPKYLGINTGNGHGEILNYDMNFNQIKLYKQKNLQLKYTKPSNFNLMVDYAKELSKEFKFVRVDFYEINGNVYLGELTFTPGNGQFLYKDYETNVWAGNLLKL